MALLIGAALAVFSVAILIYPFIKDRIHSGSRGLRTVANPASPELEPIYDAIRTLQLEYELGKVPENLYREQLRGYRIQAATELRFHSEKSGESQDWVLEQEVMLARAALQGSGGPRPCGNCRSLVAPGLAVCPECGTQMPEPST